MGFVARFFVNLALLTFSVFCLVPFMVVISASLSTEAAIGKYGYTIFPKEFSALAYQIIFRDASRVMRSYGVSTVVTVAGASAGMLVMSLMAYALSRKQFQLRQGISFYIFFTMLFSGGLVPSYILITQYLGMKNTLWVLIVPGLMSGWYVLVLRTFFQDIPEELLDAAKMDGAGEWRIFFQIAVPLSTPGLATIALFTMLGYWNDFYTALLYIEKQELYPIQYLLWVILQSAEWLQRTEQAQLMSQALRVPALPMRMAMAALAIGPIAFGYLFVQKYFIRGIRLGSLKG
ncbi:MAG: carbohydrate ABC transporter permease [Chloroflexi bacterium]|nr:carbohydrate ABC transporter permease [Chloroflexota bacterium]